jgi:hypothetical protein
MHHHFPESDQRLLGMNQRIIGTIQHLFRADQHFLGMDQHFSGMDKRMGAAKEHTPSRFDRYRRRRNSTAPAAATKINTVVGSGTGDHSTAK